MKLLCHFVVFALKPLNIFSTVFQLMSVISVDYRLMFEDSCALFLDPKVMKSTGDITSIDFTNTSIQLNDDELGIGTSTRLLLCGDLEDNMVGTAIEHPIKS